LAWPLKEIALRRQESGPFLFSIFSFNSGQLLEHSLGLNLKRKKEKKRRARANGHSVTTALRLALRSYSRN
jgi:hypothetical protein